MPSLSPIATYHAELREHLEMVGRAMSAQRGILWGARGLAVGLAVDLGILGWAWWHEAVRGLPLIGLAAVPLVLTVLVALGAMLYVRRSPEHLARRLDSAARLQERAITALELGARGGDQPLVTAQVRDTVEHLRRTEPLDIFPLRMPRIELAGSAALAFLIVLVTFAPNPWAIRARAANPAISTAREQAQRVERIADAVQADGLPELEELRELLRRGARTIETRADDPNAALGALEDLESQVRQMSMGDDQLSAALAAIASALAADPATGEMAAAINTGDLREIARASRGLGERTESMSNEERERVARQLQEAAERAARSSPTLAAQLSDAAAALEQALAQEGGGGGSGEAGEGQSGAEGEGRSAQESLDELASQAEVAAERARVRSQLEGSRNALERALGQSQSRAGPQTNRSSAARGPRGATTPGEGGELGEEEGMGEGSGGAGSEFGDEAFGDESGSGAGLGSGSSGVGDGSADALGNQVTGLDPITRPEYVGGDEFWADEMTDNPYLGMAGDGSSSVADTAANPNFTGGTTQGGDGSSIPLGLRDLVKDYFSALDQK